MENIQFSRSIGSTVYDLGFKLFFNDDFSGFRIVNNLETLHMYLRSI